jgi:hypothetical protein
MSDGIEIGTVLSNKFCISKLMGVGSFGLIYYAKNLQQTDDDSDKYVAVKVEKCNENEKKFIF